ncbi:hypothetical protein GWI33_010396 [Rhynchophorus ferrugineus]|uniref:Uncharacterized protein n=1 Tax=Rhynchophorus ferrugineus TaxID=354439 RepID=A0A834ISA4_RHYFE|nr:hypothetical protein GWI33_010396 [Rhynchophorus ferrugineus]
MDLDDDDVADAPGPDFQAILLSLSASLLQAATSEVFRGIKRARERSPADGKLTYSDASPANYGGEPPVPIEICTNKMETRIHVRFF